MSSALDIRSRRVSNGLDMTIDDDHITSLQNAALAVREAKALYDMARLHREREIRRVAAEGGTYREIGEVAGVAYQRVAQIVTGHEPPYREKNDELNFPCRTCGAAIGEECDAKAGVRTHQDRIDQALAAFRLEHPELG